MRYAIEAALDSTLLSKIVVTSDDEEILDIAGEYPGVEAIRRPGEISADHSPAIEYTMHALDMMEDTYDAVAIIQPSSPFTKGRDIDGTINLMFEKEADSAVSVVKLDHAIHPAKLKVMKDDYLVAYLEEEHGRMSSEQLSEIFVRNGSVYVTTVDVISRGKIIADNCVGYIMSRERSIDINDPIDFEFAQFLHNSTLKNG